MDKIGITFILLISLLGITPFLFTEGQIFDIKAYGVNDCDEVVLMSGVCADNVYFTIEKIILSFLGFSLPFIFSNLKRYLKALSSFVGGWYFAGLLIEVINFKYPTDELINDEVIYIKFLTTFVLGVVFIIVSETWNKQKNYEKF